MSRRAWVGAISVAVALIAAYLTWRAIGSHDEREIRTRLEELAAEFNASTTDGLGTVARAARIGQFFTSDVVVELGQGSPPIHGRETLIGMAARLQPRTAAFVVELKDINVQLLEADRAEAALTLVIRRRSIASGEESFDAREFSADLRKDDEGRWRLGRVVAIDTLR
jgi:hypothetical protein